MWHAPGVELHKLNETYPLATTQMHQAMEGRAANFRQNHLFLEIASFAHQNAGGLGHAFDDQAVRDDRKGGIQIVQVFLGQGDVLHRRRRRTRSELRELVDPDPSHELLVASC